MLLHAANPRRTNMRLLIFPELRRDKGIPYCRDYLRQLINRGEFPKPIVLGGGRIAWVEDEVDAQIEAWVARSAAAPQKQRGRKATPAPAPAPARRGRGRPRNAERVPAGAR
jgi:predicted DNA-binding transcriptional regulator AlpA